MHASIHIPVYIWWTNVNSVYHVQCSYLINILSIMLEEYSLLQGKIKY